MNDVFIEMIKQIPLGAVMLGIVWLFQTNESKREEQRIANAKERETERRNYELQVQSMWASHIKTIVDKIEVGNDKIVNALLEHEKASRERYEKMGITNDLLDMAKEKLKR